MLYVSSCKMREIHERGCLTQVVLETHSATAAFNLSHAEEAQPEENNHPDQRYNTSRNLVCIQVAMCIPQMSGAEMQTRE